MRIAIIKLGALGDVVRTMPVVKAVHDAHPQGEIVWITRENARDFLERTNFIKKVVCVPFASEEVFDALYNFDFDEEATALAESLKAHKKYGFYSEGGYVQAYNVGAEYYVNTIFDDSLKKSNTKTYQEMMCMAAEVPWRKENVAITLTSAEKEEAREYMAYQGLAGKKIVGIHIGASKRWPSKVWHEKTMRLFIQLLQEEGYAPFLFGGPAEEKTLEGLSNELKVPHNDPTNTNIAFAALVNECSAMLCPDSFSLHISIALRKPTVGLFFCTTPHEVEGFGVLEKVISPMLYEFFPEKQDEYSEALVQSVSPLEVFLALEKVITHRNQKRVVNGIVKKKDEERVLVIQRTSDDETHPGLWAFPGGVVEEGESNEEALTREMKEEVGLVVSRIGERVNSYTYTDGKGKKTTGVSFVVHTEDEQIVVGKEVAAWKWVNAQELVHLAHVPTIDEELLIALKLSEKYRE